MDSLPQSHLGSTYCILQCIFKVNLICVSKQVVPSPTLLPVLYSKFSLVTCFIHRSVYMSIPISQFIPPTPFLPWCPYICSLWLCLSYYCLTQASAHSLGLWRWSDFLGITPLARPLSSIMGWLLHVGYPQVGCTILGLGCLCDSAE